MYVPDSIDESGRKSSQGGKVTGEMFTNESAKARSGESVSQNSIK
jgi:hypothetical protein